MRPMLAGQIVLGIRNDHDAHLDIMQDGLICKSKQNMSWAGARCELGILDGVSYFEAKQISSETITSGSRAQRHQRPGIMRVGWSARAAVQRGMVILPTRELGTSNLSFGYGGTGKKSHDDRFSDYGGEFRDGDVIGCILDRVNGTVSFTRNGHWLGVAFELPRNLQDIALHPAVCLKGCTAELNLGASLFIYPPPRAYKVPYPLTLVRSTGTVNKWDGARGTGSITPVTSAPLFCHCTDVIDGNALQPGAKVQYVMVVDHTKETRRAEQISGGVTIDRKGAASDAEQIARQQAEIEALRERH